MWLQNEGMRKVRNYFFQNKVFLLNQDLAKIHYSKKHTSAT